MERMMNVGVATNTRELTWTQKIGFSKIQELYSL